jgi:hypothetical protein
VTSFRDSAFPAIPAYPECRKEISSTPGNGHQTITLRQIATEEGWVAQSQEFKVTPIISWPSISSTTWTN